MSEILIVILLLVSTFILTSIFRYVAIKRQWLDTPNGRSSHLVPTPKSGGIVFALTFSTAVIYSYVGFSLSITQTAALLVPLMVAVSGMIDDFNPLSVVGRISVQALASITVLMLLGGLPPLPVFGYMVDFGIMGYVIGLLGLIWLINLFNFMDGIDGIAGLEASFVCVAASALVLLQGGNQTAFILLALVACVSGFLLLNLPQAKIFMGDAGSQYLGLLLGALGLLTIHSGHMHIWSWAILLGVFIVDSTVTLLRRLHKGKMWYHAHRTHAYQHAAIKVASHGKVDLGITLINVCWLFPIAWVSLLLTSWSMLLTVVAYSPLVWLEFFYNAGEEGH